MKISTFTVVRIDTGGLTSISIFLNHSGTIVVRIVYDIPSESLFFALSSDTVFMKFGKGYLRYRTKYKQFYHFYFNKDILVTIQYIKLRFSACFLNTLP